VSLPKRVSPASLAASRTRLNIGTKDGSIIATIITTHIPRNDAAAIGHVCPGICMPRICMPRICMPRISDMDVHQRIVAVALAANSIAEVQ
jgi:hypothetical protein